MSPSSFRFDRFELRVDERLLYRDGQPTSLGARAVDVLTVLLDSKGRLVSKQELLDRAWPHLVVEENNLQVQISALRKWVGAQAIATVPGRGYRFCLPVQTGGTAVEGCGGDSAKAERVASTSASAGSEGLAGLPPRRGRLWGREVEQAELTLQWPAPFLTVVGPAGIGKTAFALSIAHEWKASHRDGAAWVDLAALTDPALVLTVVAQRVGVQAVAGKDPLQSLVTALRPMQMLLVLDNAEHLLAAVTQLAEAIAHGAPDVRLLITSQVPLHVAGERVFRLGPLSVPAEDMPLEQAVRHGAVALFIDQVRAIDHRFEFGDAQIPRVVALCKRLDGLALAIKLAAARVPLLGLHGVESRLVERFRLLQGSGTTGTPRQQTLLAALDWSHELLDASERAVFRRLAVTSGGFSLELARALAHDQQLDEWMVIDVLGALVDRSLVMGDSGEWPRYRLLDAMREHACIKLQASDETAAIRRRHAEAMADIMHAAYEAYWCQPDARWLARYAPDMDNVRAALEWATQHDQPLAVRLLGAAGPLFLLLGLAAECRQRAAALDVAARGMRHDPDLARFWLERSRVHWGIGNTAMHDMATLALAISREADDAQGSYLALRCLAGSGVLAAPQATDVLREMALLEQPAWPARLRAQRMLAQLGVLRAIEQMAEARRVGQNLLVTAQAAGLDGVVSAALSDLASVTLALGDTEGAMKACQQLLARGRHRRDNFVLHAQAIVACVSFVNGDLPAARSALTDFVATSRSRNWEWLGLYAGLLALLAALEGRHEAAGRLLGYASRAHEELGTRDVLTVYAWSRANSIVRDAVDAIVLNRLEEMGRDMDADAACGWALASPSP